MSGGQLARMNYAASSAYQSACFQHDPKKLTGPRNLTLCATALPEKLVATGDTKASAPMRAARANKMVLYMLELYLSNTYKRLCKLANHASEPNPTFSFGLSVRNPGVRGCH